jgi:hypothetical protein
MSDKQLEAAEFLTEETTCANVMLKRTTSQNFCQKRPPENGGTFAQATRGTCRLGQSRQPPAAYTKAGTLPRYRRRYPPTGQVGHAASGVAGMSHAASAIPGTLAADTLAADTRPHQ